jgi:ParB family chromosome partitioning protein
MPGKGGLGRGLDSLIPAGQSLATDAPTAGGVAQLPVEQIRPNPRQPRQHLDPARLTALADSLREHGVIQPIVVTRAATGDGYVLIAGERRWAAAQAAGLTTVPAVIKEATPQQMLELALVENVQRADLNPLEEAAAYQHLIAEFGLTQEEVARRVGRDRSTVANSLRLLQLPEPVQAAITHGEISEGHARALLGAGEPSEVLRLFADVVARGLNVRQTEELVRRQRTARLPGPAAELPPLAPADPEADQIEELFRQALGTRVELSRRGTGGRLVIHFYDEEQLQALYDRVSRD